MNWVRKFSISISETLLPLCLYYLINTAVFIVGTSYLESKREELSLLIFGETAYVVLSCFVKIASFLFSGAIVWNYYKREKKLSSQEEKKGLGLKNGIMLLLLGASLAVVLNLIWGSIPWFWNNQAYRQVAESQYSYPLWLALPLYGLAAPWAEEVMFRGVLFLTIRRMLGEKAGIFFSALLFGLFHGNLVQATYGMVMGAVMAFLYKRYDHLGAPFLFHSAANVTVYMVQQLL